MDILVADDEDDIREQVCAILKDEGYRPRPCATVQETLNGIEQRLPALVILDVWFQHCDKDGLYILDQLRKLHRELPVLMISGHSTVDMAVRALRNGASDFLTKPFALESLLHAVERGLREARLTRENQDMARQLGKNQPLGLSISPAMVTVMKNLKRWASTDRRLLVSGAMGSGKSHLVRHIHQISPRSTCSLQHHNCADFADDEHHIATLFGGGDEEIGKLELAHNGTLLLENIEYLSPSVQQQILHFLQSRRFQRPGKSRWVNVDVRILSTSVLPAAELRVSETFSHALYDCLALGVLELPPLRCRPEDIPTLVSSIQECLSHQFGRAIPEMKSDALAELQTHSWPNNFRELENVLTRLHYTGTTISLDLVRRAIGDETSHREQSRALQWQRLIASLGGGLRCAREEFEQYYLCYHLERFGGNVSQTAQHVGMDRASLHRKIRSLGIKWGQFSETDKTKIAPVEIAPVEVIDDQDNMPCK